MEEIICPLWFIVISFRLCKFILMMWEDEINTSGVDIHLLSQNWNSHSWTFDMPSRSSLSPWRWPFRFVGFSCFPESEIFFISFFSLFIRLLLLGFSLFDSFKFSVFEFFSESFNVKVYGSVWCIGVTVINDFFDKSNNLRNVFCNSGKIIWSFNTELTWIRWKFTSYHQRNQLTIF